MHADVHHAFLDPDTETKTFSFYKDCIIYNLFILHRTRYLKKTNQMVTQYAEQNVTMLIISFSSEMKQIQQK